MVRRPVRFILTDRIMTKLAANSTFMNQFIEFKIARKAINRRPAAGGCCGGGSNANREFYRVFRAVASSLSVERRDKLKTFLGADRVVFFNDGKKIEF